MGPVQSLDDLVSLLRRRIVPFVLILCLGALLALAYALTLGSPYEASTLIQMRTSALENEEAVPAARRVQVIEQRLMSRESVLELIRRHGLFADLPQLSDDQKVALFRTGNSIRVIDSTGSPATGGDRRISALLITSQADSAGQAAEVANDLADRLIAQDIEERTRAVDEAIGFLEGESGRVSAQLALVDDRIGEIRNANEESLPGAAEALRAELVALRELQLTLDQQGLQLEREQLAVELRATDVAGSDADMSLAARLSRLTSDLARSRRVLPADHPEIVRIEAEIAELRRDGTIEVSTGSDREAALIQSQREALDEQRQVIDARRAEIDAALERAPLVQQQLTGLERRQAQLVAQLSAVGVRLAEMQSLRALQTDNDGGAMVVLEEARPPQYPLASSRKRTVALGGMASLAAAFLAILLMEMRRPVMRSAAAVERRLGVVPLATIPALPTRAAQARRVRDAVLVVLILALTGAAGGWLYLNRDQPGIEVRLAADA